MGWTWWNRVIWLRGVPQAAAGLRSTRRTGRTRDVAGPVIEPKELDEIRAAFEPQPTMTHWHSGRAAVGCSTGPPKEVSRV